MSPLWLEAVLISYIGDSVGDTIQSSVRELTSDSNGFVFLSWVNELTSFLLGDSVTGFISGIKKGKIMLNLNLFGFHFMFPLFR